MGTVHGMRSKWRRQRYTPVALAMLVLYCAVAVAQGPPPPEITINNLITADRTPTLSGTVNQAPLDPYPFLLSIYVSTGSSSTTVIQTSDSANADFQIFSIDPESNSAMHAYGWRMTLGNMLQENMTLFDVECVLNVDGIEVLAGTMLTISTASGQPILDAAPRLKNFLFNEPSGEVAEVYNGGTGSTNWSARLIPGRNWDPAVDTNSLELTQVSPVDYDNNPVAFTEGGLSLGTIAIDLGGINTAPFDRHATVEIFPIDDIGVRIPPGTDSDNMPVNEPVSVGIVHLKVFDTIDTALEAPAGGLRFVSGHVGNNYFSYDPVTPSPVDRGDPPHTQDEGVHLVTAAFGQSVGFSPVALSASVTNLLFAAQDGPFRFNTILFGQNTLDDTTDTNGYQENPGLSDYENAQNRVAQLQFNRDAFLNSLFTSEDRETLEALKEVYRDLLRFNPEDRVARNALLDIAFYQASLQVVKAKETMFRGYSQRLFPRDPLRPIISNEIELFEQAAALFDSAMDPYFMLWADVIGFAGEGQGEPFGMKIFREEAPYRRVGDMGFDAICDPLRAIGETADCTESFDFPGMRDLDLIYDIYNYQAQAAVEVLKLRGLRFSTVDRLRSGALVRRFEHRVGPEFELVSEVIPDWRTYLTPRAHTAALFTGALTGFQQVALMKGFLEGERNVLGFDKDFLLLVQAFPQVGDEIFDTFNQILQFNDPFSGFVTPLGLARQKLVDARASYFSYRGQEDELSETFRVQNLEIRNRLRQITGVDPGQDIDNPAGRYLTPLDNPGGDLNRQRQSINLEGIRLDITNAEGNVLLNNIENQIQIAARTADISADIQDVIIRRGNDRMGFQIGIGAANALVAVGEGSRDIALFNSQGTGTLNPTNTGSVGNAFLATATAVVGEILAGTFEGMIEQYSALESSEIKGLETVLDNYIRSQDIENLMQEVVVSNLQTLEAEQVIRVERDRLTALEIEKMGLEQRMRENNQALVDRFFADPIHRLLFQADTFEAQQAFQSAQRWMFYAVQALEYKWNTPFLYNDGVAAYTADSLFGLRNAEELEEFVAAMVNFDGLMELSRRGDDRYDVLSMKEDLYGLPELDGDGTPATFPNTVDENSPILSDVAWLRALNDARDENSGVITLRFSTAKDFGGTFYRGPRFGADDAAGYPTLIDKGMFVDKIVWMRVDLVLAEVATDDPDIEEDLTNSPQPDFLEATLTYGGNGYLRNSNPGERMGATTDTGEPIIRFANEQKIYPARFWYFDPGDPTANPPVPQNFRTRLGQPAPIKLQVNPNATIPEEAAQINVFKEYSVAADGWTLSIQTKDANGNTLIDIGRIQDIELAFFHNAKDRP